MTDTLDKTAPRLALATHEAPPQTDIAIQSINGVPMVSSREVAERFEKPHDKVLRAVRNLECSSDFTAANFGVSDYRDATGRSLPAYNLTRDGFTFLAMGFTGKAAAAWKERFIGAFNAMEAQVRQSQAAPMIDYSDPRVVMGVIGHFQGEIAQKDSVIEAQGAKLEKVARLEAADGAVSFTEAAKMLKMRPKDLFARLQAERWIYKRDGGPWLGYQSKIQAGYLSHTETTVSRSDGSEKVAVQCRITAKGLHRIAERMSMDC
jgi:Rha family phage regulatory protein